MWVNVLLLILIWSRSGLCWNKQGTLVFEESFEGSSLNENIWELQEGSATSCCAGILQEFRKENVFIQNGSLKLEAKKIPNISSRKHFDNFTSAEIKLKRPLTKDSTVIIRAKMATGDFLYSFLWIGKNNQACRYEEIQLGGVRDQPEDGHKADISASWGKIWARMTSVMKEIEVNGDNLLEQFHEYGLTWKSRKLTFRLDGTISLEVSLEDTAFLGNSRNYPCAGSLEPFGEPMHLVISLLVGGPFFGKHSLPMRKNSWRNPVMEIDSVKVYRL